MRRIVAIVIAILLGVQIAEAGKRIVVDLSKQEAYAYEDGRLVFSGWVSTGKPGHRTPTGHFRVLEKDIDHVSSKYPEPNGGAEMHYMLRVTDYGVAMHLGYVPNYPASHGCIRMENGFAQKMYHWAEVGTPVFIMGTPPRYVDRPISRYASAPVTRSARETSPGTTERANGPLGLLSTVPQTGAVTSNRMTRHSLKRTRQVARKKRRTSPLVRSAETTAPLQLLSTVPSRKRKVAVATSQTHPSRNFQRQRDLQGDRDGQSNRFVAMNDPLHLLTTVPQKKNVSQTHRKKKRITQKKRKRYETRSRKVRRSAGKVTEVEKKIGNTPLAMLREHG